MKAGRDSTLGVRQRSDEPAVRGHERVVFAAVYSHGKVRELVQGIVNEVNSKCASFEAIKKFAILEKDFTQETGELTPTLKVKRKVVTEKYKSLLDGFYS